MLRLRLRKHIQDIITFPQSCPYSLFVEIGNFLTSFLEVQPPLHLYNAFILQQHQLKVLLIEILIKIKKSRIAYS